MKNATKIFLFCGLVFLASCSERKESISIEIIKSDYGSSWPFTSHATAILSCEIRGFDGVDRPLITVRLGQVTYGLNGAAMGVGGYPDARTQMAKHPEYGTYELGATQDLINLAQKSCGREN